MYASIRGSPQRIVFETEAGGQRRAGVIRRLRKAQADGYSVIGGAAGAASALVRRQTRTERGSRSPICARLAGFQWRGAAPQSGKRWAKEGKSLPKFCVRNEAHWAAK